MAHLRRPVDSKLDHLVRGQREGRDRAAFSFHLATDAVDTLRFSGRREWLRLQCAAARHRGPVGARVGEEVK